MTLIESSGRACAFLRRVISELSLPASVVGEAAEVAARRSELREGFDVVLSRAVAPPPAILELTLPFVRVGGRAALLVGSSYSEHTAAAAAAAGVLGGGDPGYVPLEVPGANAGTWVMMVGKVDPTPERYPRRPGVPRRRPLGGGVTGVS